MNPPEEKAARNRKRYTQRGERHNLNLRRFARLDDRCRVLSRGELPNKVIGHYLNIKHYQ
ncbi:IS1 family transposase [Escherichia coli]|uniref:IS1 family transposase n=1 Tax=Escherichia coli TaxID=562 RepID=UPI00254EC7CC|nr:IS1 family transposase [Escherichia coli]